MNQEKKQVWSSEDAIARGKTRLARLHELSKLSGASVTATKPIPSKAPEPIEAIPSSGYVKPKPAPIPIDWAHWQNMPIVALWEAVALSLNMNPKNAGSKKDDTALDKRMSVALSNVDAGHLALVEHCPANRPVSRVALSVFAAWVSSKNFSDVPFELVAMAEKAYLPEAKTGALAEFVWNDKPIDWEYWFGKLPNLNADEACRLMSGLDPIVFEDLDIYKDLNQRPNDNNPRQASEKAKEMLRLAMRENKTNATSTQWMEWVTVRGYEVHAGYRLALSTYLVQPEGESGANDTPPAPVEPAKATAPDFVKSDSTTPTTAPEVTECAPDDLKWNLKKPLRFQGYSKPLYDLLKAEHTAGKQCPRARDVLDKWKLKMPHDVTEVSDSGLKYIGAKGNTKPADLDAIRKAIARMTG